MINAHIMERAADVVDGVLHDELLKHITAVSVVLNVSTEAYDVVITGFEGNDCSAYNIRTVKRSVS